MFLDLVFQKTDNNGENLIDLQDFNEIYHKYLFFSQ